MGSAKENTALVAQDQVFDVSFLPDVTDIEEVMTSNMEGVDMRFERVKVPSGGGIVWEVPNEDGDTDTEKELVGIIIDHHPVNAYWEEEYSGESNPPDCSSLDGRSSLDGKFCATCPKNQFGSDPKGGRGKACKNLHRTYIVRQGEVFPLLLAVPPTSLDNFRTYMRRLTSKMRRATSVLTKFTLTKDKNDGGILYSKIEFRRVGDLDKDAAQKMAEFAKVMKPYLRSIAITEDEYNTADGDGDVETNADITIDLGNGDYTHYGDGQAGFRNRRESESHKAW